MEGKRKGCGGGGKRKGGRPGEPFHATPNHFHPCISQIVSHYSASTPIQTGTEETRSILPPNWSFPGEALVCKTYFQDRAFLNKQGLKTEATSGRQAGWQADIDWVRPNSKWADCRVGNLLHQLLVSYLPYVKEERYILGELQSQWWCRQTKCISITMSLTVKLHNSLMLLIIEVGPPNVKSGVNSSI